MNKKRIFSIILMFIGIICIGTSCYMYYSDDNSNINDVETDSDKTTEEVTHTTEVENVIKNTFLSTDTSSDKISSVIEDNIIGTSHIVLGTDSYLRSIPDTTEDLSKYQEQQEIYAKKVEDRYIAGTSYTVDELEDGNLNFVITPWYFALYSSDTNYITNKLLDMAGIDENLVETNYSEYSVYAYKAKIKAMMILDSYLDIYDNRDEQLNLVFYYDGDTPSENQYFSLYYCFIGSQSQYMPSTQEEREEQYKRLDTYIEDAMTNNIIDENNPLAI